MTDHVFDVGVGLEPIRFGMTRNQVVAILGHPKKQYRFSEQGTSSSELDAIIGAAGMDDATAHLATIYRGQLIDSYNEGTCDGWNGGGPLSFISSVTYVDGTVSKITCLDCRDRIFFKDIELTAEDLYRSIRSLHTISEEMYVDSDNLFFDELGIVMTLVRDKQRFVSVTDGRAEEALFDSEEYVFLELEELEAFISGELQRGDEGC